MFRKFRSEITLIEARFNNPFDRLNAGLENAFLGSYHTDNGVRRGGKFMTYMPFKQCHLASINLKISLNAYFTLGVLDKWRAYARNGGKPLKAKDMTGEYYRTVPEIQNLKPYLLDENVEMDSDLRLALQGIPIDEDQLPSPNHVQDVE